jgi:hypothetical protein
MKKLERKFAGKLAAALFKVALAMMKLSAKLAGRIAADDAREHIRITVLLANWPAKTADALIAHGVAPAVVARMFAHGAGLPPQ